MYKSHKKNWPAVGPCPHGWHVSIWDGLEDCWSVKTTGGRDTSSVHDFVSKRVIGIFSNAPWSHKCKWNQCPRTWQLAQACDCVFKQHSYLPPKTILKKWGRCFSLIFIFYLLICWNLNYVQRKWKRKFMWSNFQIVESYCCAVIFAQSVSIWLLVLSNNNFVRQWIHRPNQHLLLHQFVQNVVFTVNDCLWSVAMVWIKINLFVLNDANHLQTPWPHYP